MKAMDIRGMKFRRLTVIEDTGKRHHRAVVWKCKCDCGGTKEATAQSLRSGDVKSCGCLMRPGYKILKGKRVYPEDCVEA